MYIKRSSIYKHQIQIDYSKKMNGLTNKFHIFKTGIWNQTEPEKNFNNWIFESPQSWLDFWYTKSSIILFESQNHVLGTSSS